MDAIDALHYSLKTVRKSAPCIHLEYQDIAHRWWVKKVEKK